MTFTRNARIAKESLTLQERKVIWVGLMTETFIAKIQAQNRIVIPILYVEALKVREGDKVRISIEKVK